MSPLTAYAGTAASTLKPTARSAFLMTDLPCCALNAVGVTIVVLTITTTRIKYNCCRIADKAAAA